MMLNDLSTPITTEQEIVPNSGNISHALSNPTTIHLSVGEKFNISFVDIVDVRPSSLPNVRINYTYYKNS